MKACLRSRGLASLLVVAFPVSAILAQSHPHGEQEHGDQEHGTHDRESHSESDAGMRHVGAIDHSFADAEAWAERFEGADRDEWQQPDRVVAELALAPGMTVADIGSGTGYFARRFAEAVGPHGTVFAADVEPEMGAYVRKRADEDDQANLVPVLASYDDPRLPDGGADLIFICNTWHHIQDRVEYAKRLAGDLKPGGRIVVLDFVKGPLPMGPAPEHKLSAEDVTGELLEAGFRLADRFDELPYQFLLTFEFSGHAD